MFSSIEIFEILSKCLIKLESDKYSGYDPADLLNSKMEFINALHGPFLKLLSLANIYSPINLRKLLRIIPEQNSSAMVVLGLTYCNLYKYTSEKIYLEKALWFSEWLVDKAIKEKEEFGWSRIVNYQYDSQTLINRNSVLTFINAFCIQLFLLLFKFTREDKFLVYAIYAGNYLINRTKRIETKCGICLSYVDNVSLEIVNAAILAGRELNRLFCFTKNTSYLELSYNIIDYTINRQNSDGSWYYSFNKERVKKQIDFHQSYILMGIRDYECLKEELRQRAEISYSKGLNFYVNRMFDKNMMPYWRLPFKYPIDIHNLSHAVYFFSKYNKDIPDVKNRLGKLIEILLRDFYQPEEHYFFYQKFPFFTNKIDYFRWNDAWTLFALSEYLLMDSSLGKKE